MKIKKVYKIIFLALLLPFSVHSQNCEKFLNSKIFKLPNPGSFLSYSQSKGIPVPVRKKVSFNIIFIGKNEYKMAIATESDYEPVHFRMIETNTQKVLFDNKKYQYLPSVSFYIEKTQSITIEVTVLAVDESFILDEDLQVCLGIKIYNQLIE